MAGGLVCDQPMQLDSFSGTSPTSAHSSSLCSTEPKPQTLSCVTPFLPPLLFSAQRRMMVYKDTSDCVQIPCALGCKPLAGLIHLSLLCSHTKLIPLFGSLPKSIPLPGISFLRSLCSSIFLGLGLQIQIRGDRFRPGTASARPLTSLCPF